MLDGVKCSGLPSLASLLCFSSSLAPLAFFLSVSLLP